MDLSWITYFIGFVLVVGFVFVIAFATRRQEKNRYDERQVLARLQAYELSFFILIGWNLLWATAAVVFGRQFFQPGLELLLGVLLAMTVFGVFCVCKGAFSAGKRRGETAYMILLAIVGASNVVTGVGRVRAEGLIEDGVLKSSVLPLVLAGIFLVMLIALGVKRLVDRRGASE